MNAYLQRAAVLLGQHRIELAEAEARRGLAEDPQNAWGHAVLSLCLKSAGKNEEAVEEARQAVHLDPEMPLAHYAYAEALYELDRLDEALAAIDEAIRLDPRDADYHSAKGWIFYRQRSWPRALACAEKGLECDPEHIDSRNLRSMSLVKLGRKTEALDAAGETLARDPENAGAHAVQGWNYLEHGDPPKALDHFREALRINPNLEYARHGMVEALKARHIVYRWMLKYFLWMGKLSRTAQWGVVIGLLVGYRIVRAIHTANPEWGPVLVPLIILYFAFFYISWVADPLFNLLLRSSRFGRYALSADETRATNWFGGFLAVAVVAGTAALILRDWRVGGFAIWAATMTIPAAIAFSPRNRKSRSLPLIALCLAVIGFAAAFAFAFEPDNGPFFDPLFTTYLLGWVGLTWFGNSEWFRTH